MKPRSKPPKTKASLKYTNIYPKRSVINRQRRSV
jgi:hypothetical protein